MLFGLVLLIVICCTLFEFCASDCRLCLLAWRCVLFCLFVFWVCYLFAFACFWLLFVVNAYAGVCFVRLRLVCLRMLLF